MTYLNEQIKKDVEFLSFMGVTDYSFLVGIPDDAVYVPQYPNQ